MDNVTAETPAPEKIGSILKAEREAYGVSLEEVSARLKIRLVYLQAIEANSYNELPGQAYAFGFIRAYTEALGLDSEAALDIYREELSEVPLTREIPKNKRQKLPVLAHTSTPHLLHLFLALGFLLLAASLWFLFRPVSKEQPVTPPAQKQVAQQNQTTQKPVAVTPAVKAVPVAPKTTPQATNTPAETIKIPAQSAPEVTYTPTYSPETDLATIIPEPKPDVSSLAVTAILGEPSPNLSSLPVGASYGEQNKNSRIRIVASQPAHLTVFQNGTQIFPSTGEPSILGVGASYWVPAEGEIQISTGNGGALFAVVNGKQTYTFDLTGQTLNKKSLAGYLTKLQN